jgi:hypothetical protein
MVMTFAIPMLALALAGAPAKAVQPADERPRFTGIGLIAGASVAGIASISMTSVRIDLENWNCPRPEHDSDSQGSYSYDPDYCKVDTITGLMVPNIVANLTALALAPAAGVVRGRYDAWRYRTTGEPRRRYRLIIGIGAGLVAVGLSTLVFVPYLPFCSGASVVRPIALAQIGASVTGAGVGLWAYGGIYAKHRTRALRLTLLPQLGPDRVGLSVGSRF